MISKQDVIDFLKNDYYCRIKPSLIHGVGVFAIKDIPRGVNPFIPFEDSVNFNFQLDELSDVNTNIVNVFESRYFSPSDGVNIVLNKCNTTHYVDYINHSLKPNVVYFYENGKYNWETLVDIKEGEELTHNYNNVELNSEGYCK
tara:strand:+ start:249 stop:680 length:432 start_codon:yes stop_codon:yes gene_type:complete